ncbi:MAG: AsmA family protein [Alphaproteobacteria bacterium]
MRALFGIILTGLLLLVAAAVAIPFLVSTDWIREQIVVAVKERTGRDLTIAGDTSLSVLTGLSLSVGQVALSHPPTHAGGGAAGDAFMQIERLELGLKFWPLVSGQAEVDKFVLTRPVLNLVVDAKGQRNWSFGETQEPTIASLINSAETGGRPPAETSDRAVQMTPAINSLSLGDVRMIDGRVTYTDLRGGDTQSLTEINATLRLTDLEDPLQLEGTLLWQGEQVAFTTELAEPRALTTGTPTKASLSLQAPQISVSFNGTVAVKDTMEAAGDLKLTSPSLKNFMRWLGTEPPRITGLEAFSLSAAITTQPRQIVLNQAKLSLDGIAAEGGALVDFSGDKPLIRATLALSGIDLNNYRPVDVAPGPAQGSAPTPATPGKSDGGKSEWDAAPIDVSGLAMVDADIRISATGLTYQKIKVGQSALAITLRDAILSVDLSELQLYQGRAAGKLTVNGARKTPAIAAAFTINNISALPLLTDSIGLTWIEGRGRITGSLASRGLTQRRLIGALNGTVTMQFNDGAVRGINVAQMVRDAQAGKFSGLTADTAQKTDFSEFSTRFAIASGIASTDSIKLLSPLVRMSGAGIVDLPRQSIDMRLSPKLVASLDGQGGDQLLGGLEIPILVQGPWANPKITPDLEVLVRNPDQVLKSIDTIGKSLEKLRKGEIGEQIEALTGQNTGDLLKLFLGTQKSN